MSTALELENLARSVGATLSQLEGEIEGQLSAVVSLRNECAGADSSSIESSSENWSSLQVHAGKVEAEAQTSSLKNAMAIKQQEIESKKEIIRVLEESEAKLKAFQDQVAEAKGAVGSLGSFQKTSSELIQRASQAQKQALQSLEEDALYGWNKGKNYLEDELNAEIDRAVAALDYDLKTEVRQMESFMTSQFIYIRAQLSALQGSSAATEAEGAGSERTEELIGEFTQGVQIGFENLTQEADLTAGQVVELSKVFQQFTKHFRTVPPSSVKTT
jgi:hypothetical protein